LHKGDLSQDTESKKTKLSSAESTTLEETWKPPNHLSLSVLTWDGPPTTFCVDGEAMVDYVGVYEEAIRPLKVILRGWNEEQGAFEYAPSRSRGSADFSTFQYNRAAFTGTASSDITYYGGIIASNISPIMRLSITGQNPWSEKFPISECAVGCFEICVHSRLLTIFFPFFKQAALEPGVVDLGPSIEMRNPSGPPFQFFESDFQEQDGWPPERLSTRSTVMTTPDLPGQSHEDAEPDFISCGDDEAGSDFEQDSTEGMGWRGSWVDALLTRRRNGESLGKREGVYWSSWNRENERNFGVEMRLKVSDVFNRLRQKILFYFFRQSELIPLSTPTVRRNPTVTRKLRRDAEGLAHTPLKPRF